MYANNNQTLRIGWAAQDITPNRPVLLDGQFHTRISEKVNDPITVTALAMESGGNSTAGQVIWISCDMVGIPHDILLRVRKELDGRVPGFDLRHLVINATHTHTSMVLKDEKYLYPEDADIMTPDQCAEMLVGRMAAAAETAWQQRKPGGISSGYGFAVVGHNRRSSFFDGSSKMYAKINDPEFDCFEGYEDHGVDVLFTWDEDKKLTGMVVNLACPSQDTEGASFVSADFWHETREALREQHGRDLFILPQCAPAGDQSPHPQLCKNLRNHMFERQGITERQAIARRIAAAVDEAMIGADNEIETDVTLLHAVEDCRLPRRMVTDTEYEQAKREVTELEANREMTDSVRHSHIRRNREVIARHESQQNDPYHTIELHVLRMGAIVMASNPFELFLDYGVRIKARSPALQNFLVQIACGYDGYLPTAKAMGAKLHEADRTRPGFSGNYGAGVASNLVGPEGGQVLVERTLELIQGMIKEADSSNDEY